MRTLVILEVMWGWSGIRYKEAPRTYHINPENFSGKRLYRLLGDDTFVVANACPEYVATANGKGTPDPVRLRSILKEHDPDRVLVCGRVAQETFVRDMVRPGTVVVQMPHPAARGWTRAGLDVAQKAIAEGRDVTLTMKGESSYPSPLASPEVVR